MFVDRIKVYVKAGNGGNGCASFRREKYVPKGGPNGGNGGHGGNVIFRADKSKNSLVDLKYQQHIEAQNGEPGQGKDKIGANGEDLIILVPPGTLVMDLDNDCYEIDDLEDEGQEVLVAAGGHGGRGNKSFASSVDRAPRKSTPGIPGEERTLLLELKTVADVGLVGYPNAGKSTFLKAVTNAEPKTAPYPFTTLHPMVGVIEFEDFSRMTIADIPGLIEGASENIGLGHHFLRHIERTKVLLYILDMAGTDNRLPWDDFKSLQNELELYKEGLTSKPSIILANKMDEPVSAENLKKLKRRVKLPIFQGIAELGEGMEEIIKELRKMVTHLKLTEKKVKRLKNIHQDGEKIVVNLQDEVNDEFV